MAPNKTQQLPRFFSSLDKFNRTQTYKSTFKPPSLLYVNAKTSADSFYFPQNSSRDTIPLILFKSFLRLTDLLIESKNLDVILFGTCVSVLQFHDIRLLVRYSNATATDSFLTKPVQEFPFIFICNKSINNLYCIVQIIPLLSDRGNQPCFLGYNALLRINYNRRVSCLLNSNTQ